MSLNPDNQSAMPSHHQTEPPSYKSTFVGVILHVRAPSFTPMPGVYFQLKLISTPLIIPHDNHGHDHDHHDFFKNTSSNNPVHSLILRRSPFFDPLPKQPDTTHDLRPVQLPNQISLKHAKTCNLRTETCLDLNKCAFALRLHL